MSSKKSKYVIETGNGYLGTFGVNNNWCGVNVSPVGYTAGTKVDVVAADADRARIEKCQSTSREVLERKPVNRKEYLELTSQTLSHLGVTDGDDLRLYEARSGPGCIVVPAAADPFVGRDGN